MIVLNIKCEQDEAAFLRDRMCEALAGSPAFIDSEIGVCDVSTSEFCLVIGHRNGSDVEFDVKESDLTEVSAAQQSE